jgi:hypothetical protein
MSAVEEPRVYEIRIGGFANSAEAFALQEQIARLLCPDEEHTGPCDIPWEFGLGDADDADPDDERTVLVLGVHTLGARAADVADRVRATVGEARPVVWGPGDPADFEALIEQYRIESALPRGGADGDRP